MEHEDQAENADSPTAENISAESQTAPAAPAADHADDSTVAADPSPAEAEAKPPKSSLEAVEQALKKQRAAAQPEAKADATKAGESPAQSGKEGEGSEADPKAEGAEPGKRNAESRIKSLLADKAELAPKAEAFENLTGFMHANSITQEDFTQALQMLTLSKSDPVAFLQAVESLAADTRKAVGLDRLPADLQARVDSGVTDEATARDLHAARLSLNSTRENQQRAAERDQQQRDQQDRETHVSSVMAAVATWEQQAEKTDADFPRLRRLVHAEVVRLINTEGPPDSPQSAVVQAKKALANVKAEVGSLVEKRPVKFVPSGGNEKPVVRPKSSLEAAEAALRGQKTAY